MNDSDGGVVEEKEFIKHSKILQKLLRAHEEIGTRLLGNLVATIRTTAKDEFDDAQNSNQELFKQIYPLKEQLGVKWRIDREKKPNLPEKGEEIGYYLDNFKIGKVVKTKPQTLAPFLAWLWWKNTDTARAFYESVNKEIGRINKTGIYKKLEEIELTEFDVLPTTNHFSDTEPLLTSSDSAPPSSNIDFPGSLFDGVMKHWHEKVLTLPEWDPVQLIFRRRDAQGTLYQPVYLSPLDLKHKVMLNEHGDVVEYQQQRRSTEEILSAISVDSLFTVLDSWSVLLGIPGSGKTSTMKWVLRQIANRTIEDFNYAIFLPLADLVDYLARHTNSNLYTFFFEKCVGSFHEEAELLGQILKTFVESQPHSCVFLLDGFDEVSPSRRRALLSTLYHDLSQQRVIVTSRPSASAVLSVFQGLSFYEIVPLSPASIRRLVVNFSIEYKCNRSTSDILRMLSHNASLQQIVLTPFLLVIACEILHRIEDVNSAQNVTQTWLFTKLVEFVQLEYNRRSNEQLGAQDIDLLIDFAEQLSFQSPSKRLNGTASKSLTEREGIIKSRFLNEVGFHTGKFEFAHLRLQEFFGAHAILRSGNERIKEFIEHKAFTPCWLEEACFIAGLASDHSPHEEPWSSLQSQMSWIQDELTGNAWLRLGQIIAAAGMEEGGKRCLRLDVRDVLIHMVLDGHSLLEKIVSTLIEMDAEYFIHELWRHEASDKVWESIYRLIPLAIRDRTGLFQWIRDRPTLSWMQWIQGFGFTDEKTLINYRKVITDPKSSQGDQLRAIQRIGWTGDDLAIDLLRPYVTEPSFASNTAAIALSKIGGSEAARVLADAIIASPYAVEKNLRGYANALQLGRFGALEPRSRDRLVDWLVEQHAPYPINTKFVLAALKGARLPKRGAEKICRMFLHESRDDTLTKTLLYVIPGIHEHDLLHDLFEYALEQRDRDLEKKLLSLIPFLPLGDTQRLQEIYERCGNAHEESQLTYLELLAKTYKKFPNAGALKKIPISIERLLRNSGLIDVNYIVKLWRIAKLVDSDGINVFAWEKILSDTDVLPMKSALLNFIESQSFIPETERVEKFKECLKIDQTKPELRAYVRDGLRYLVSRTDQNVTKLLTYIDTSFCVDMREFSKQTVLEEAARNGQLVMPSIST